MPYNPTTWKDRAVERPRTYNLQQNPDGTVTLIPVPGTVYEPGTPVSAGNMNKIEQGIAAAVPLDGSVPMTGELRTPRVWADIGIEDTRSQQINPGDIARAVTIDFKEGATIGLTGAYYVVWTFRGWHDDSGGPATQFAFGADGPWIRTGTASAGWGAWSKLWTSSNDGSGSDLDADTLDGLHASDFIQTGGVWTTFTRDFRAHNKRAFVAFNTADGDALAINFNRDFANGVHVGGPLSVDGNRVWDASMLRVNNGVLEFWTGGAWQPVGGIKGVQRGYTSINFGTNNANKYHDISISTVNPSKTQINLLTSPIYTVGWMSIRLIGATTIRVEWTYRPNTGDDWNLISWEAIESY